MKQGLYLWICTLTTVSFIVLSLNVGSTFSRETSQLYSTFPPHLENLEQFEFKIVKNLTQALLGSRLLPIRSTIRKLVHTYLIDFYQSTGYSQIKDVIGKEQTGASLSPICAHRLIRRSWLLLKNLITQKDFILKFGSLRSEIVYFFWRNGWPLFRDHKNSVVKILTLQDVYNLEAEKLVHGKLLGIQTNCTLSSTPSYEIATIALRAEKFTLALEWLELAKERAWVDKRTSVAFIEFSIWTATDEHNLAFGYKKGLRPTFYNRRVRYIPGDSKRAQKDRNIQYNKFKGNRENSHDNINYWGLCSGENYQTEEEKSFLFCWLEFKLHPGLTIGPLKMEFLARNPDVVQVYDILEDKHMDTIISEAKKIEAGSGSLKESFGEASPHPGCLVQAEFVVGSDDAYGNVLSKKIRQFSGLSNISPEFQVESFSFRGHHQPRNDQILSKFNASAGPIAHFVFHFNSVDSGGYIAFPSLGVAAKPDKGSVVFWYSQYVDGRTDSSTNYGSCPVLVGQKWVVNKWIRSNHQLLEQKCGLNSNERLRFPVNNKYLPIPKIVIDLAEVDPSPRYPNGDPERLAKYSYMSPRALRSLVQLEWNIYPIIKHLYIKYRNQTKGTFREEFDNQNKDIKMYLENFEKCTTNVLGSMDYISSIDSKIVEKVALNLLASYKLVTRFMDYIQTWVQKKSWRGNILKTKISSYLATVYNISDGPTESDFESAMFAVLHIHYVHNLNAKDIANGVVAGVNTGVTLNARDCWNIGKHTVSFSFIVSALNWLEHAEYLVKNGSDDSVKYEDVYDDLATVQLQYDCTFHPHKPICHGTRGRSHDNMGKTDHLEVKFWSMCKGKTFQTEEEKSKLFCWYEREVHPSYKISPVKAEWLSLRPKADVVYFHDIISDRLMNSLINFTYENGAREALMNPYGELYIDPLHRHVLYAWADPHENKAAMYTSELAERITGLKIVNKTEGPHLRISGYAPGGHRSYHHDTMQNLHVATFMFYFSEVDKGGETPFTNSGVNVIPRKGSALFWYNLFTDGITDQSTIHGGCPVIMGEKWASIRWILYKWQDQLKCDLKPETRFEILVNGKSKYK
ncbi:unnamed protein product [Allacma fusca]|uniref:procollagen-proline 4-dioxygenase n=1 Tax=Allacma fusca TaxID=39272 RepID=A0A8J2JY65_9HEXA|nr:unnamed protein product [Allacma fusca]